MARTSAIDDASARRGLVPDAARRSPWLAAIWTGLGAAVVCATLAIVVVALCWLPVSGTTGRTTSAIRAGLLSFLAAVHGGITVDGVSTRWLPLGMLLLVGLTAWRAGTGLADAADALGERDPLRLTLIGATQALSFTAGCLLAVPFATLGTSRAPFLGVAAAALVLFIVTGGTSFVRSSALRDACAAHSPAWLGAVLRAAGVAVAVYLTAGALLVAGSLVMHHTGLQTLSVKVGGGWSGVPILLLGILAAPNGVIAGASYLAGPGFAVGTGTTVSVLGVAHGTLPAFPLLAAVPSGGANLVGWIMVGLTPLLAGLAAARAATRVPGWWQRLAVAAAAAVVAGLAMLVLGWQGGGSVGGGRLQTVGASPWRLGAMVAAAVALSSAVWLGFAATWQVLRARRRSDFDTGDSADRDAGERVDTADAPTRGHLVMVTADASDVDDDAAESGELAG